jgi:hypothetical protein
MFQLDRLLVSDNEKKDYPDTVFGKAFESGVCSYLINQDQDKALFQLFLRYHPLLETEKKNLELCCFLLLRAFPELDKLLMDWEVIYFNGKPALELSFRLNIDSTYYFVGYVDVVLKNRWTGRVAVLDNKTTGLQLYDLSPMYQNSDQCVGYSIVIDQIVGEENAEYDVLYFVGQIGKSPFSGSKVSLMTFPKSLQDRLHWFISLGLDVEHLKAMRDINVFPQRGSSCLQYMRPCKHFGTCGLHGLDQEKPAEEDLVEYQFTYSLDTVIEDHIRRISNA